MGDRVQIVYYDGTPCPGRIGTLVEAEKVLLDKGTFCFARREDIALVSKPLSTDAPGGGPNGIVAIGAEDGSGEEEVRIKEKRKWKEEMALEKQNEKWARRRGAIVAPSRTAEGFRLTAGNQQSFCLQDFEVAFSKPPYNFLGPVYDMNGDIVSVEYMIDSEKKTMSYMDKGQVRSFENIKSKRDLQKSDVVKKVC